jgi:hypothetical protein
MSAGSWKSRPGFPPADLDEAAARVETLRAPLERRVWPPVTNMLIPSVLGAADRTLAWLAAYRGPEPERAEALHAELAALRRKFRVGPTPPEGTRDPTHAPET